MTITLTASEQALLTDIRVALEPLEDVFHRFMKPLVAKRSEAQLQRLADEYRALTPDMQEEALQVLRDWKNSKGA